MPKCCRCHSPASWLPLSSSKGSVCRKIHKFIVAHPALSFKCSPKRRRDPARFPTLHTNFTKMLLRKISHNLAVTQLNALFIGVLHILHRVFHTVMSTFEIRKKTRAAHTPAGRSVFRIRCFYRAPFQPAGCPEFFCSCKCNICAHLDMLIYCQKKSLSP